MDYWGAKGYVGLPPLKLLGGGGWPPLAPLFLRLCPTKLCYTRLFGQGFACQDNGHSSHTKSSTPFQIIYGKKASKSAKYRLPRRKKKKKKKRLNKIKMYLGLDIIIKLKFTTNFDRCAILNVFNCLTRDFEH